MDGYTKYIQMESKYREFTPELKMRWHLENDCTCKVVEGWTEPENHYGGCPLENPDCEMWLFFEGYEMGFVFPS